MNYKKIYYRASTFILFLLTVGAACFFHSCQPLFVGKPELIIGDSLLDSNRNKRWLQQSLNDRYNFIYIDTLNKAMTAVKVASFSITKADEATESDLLFDSKPLLKPNEELLGVRINDDFNKLALFISEDKVKSYVLITDINGKEIERYSNSLGTIRDGGFMEKDGKWAFWVHYQGKNLRNFGKDTTAFAYPRDAIAKSSNLMPNMINRSSWGDVAVYYRDLREVEFYPGLYRQSSTKVKSTLFSGSYYFDLVASNWYRSQEFAYIHRRGGDYNYGFSCDHIAFKTNSVRLFLGSIYVDWENIASAMCNNSGLLALSYKANICTIGFNNQSTGNQTKFRSILKIGFNQSLVTGNSRIRFQPL